MVRRTYTPEERAERRRRSSSYSREVKQLIDDVDEGDNDSDTASWVKDLREQGVDVDEFLSTAFPSMIDIPGDFNAAADDDDQSLDKSDNSPNNERGSGITRESGRSSLLTKGSSGRSGLSKGTSGRRSGLSKGTSLRSQLTKAQRSSIISRISDHPDVDEDLKKRVSESVDRSYNYDETTAGKNMVKKSLEKMSDQDWQRWVTRDSKNYDPSSTNEEKIQSNREWALKMARKRIAAAGYKKPVVDTTPNKEEDTRMIKNTKIDPPETTPLPPITEDDFKDIQVHSFNPRELGIFPPSLPHQLIDIVPKAKRGTGIADGIVIHGTYEERLESIDSETMVVACVNPECPSFLYCSRGASLVRCDSCRTVSPACPETVRPGQCEQEWSASQSQSSLSSVEEEYGDVRNDV